jgi:hypothetical protein
MSILWNKTAHLRFLSDETKGRRGLEMGLFFLRIKNTACLVVGPSDTICDVLLLLLLGQDTIALQRTTYIQMKT